MMANESELEEKVEELEEKIEALAQRVEIIEALIVSPKLLD
jgi:uncharacterized protein YceH (UPF0502 family)